MGRKGRSATPQQGMELLLDLKAPFRLFVTQRLINIGEGLFPFPPRRAFPARFIQNPPGFQVIVGQQEVGEKKDFRSFKKHVFTGVMPDIIQDHEEKFVRSIVQLQSLGKRFPQEFFFRFGLLLNPPAVKIPDFLGVLPYDFLPFVLLQDGFQIDLG